MNSLEAEYSFLAPTWKLPTVATSSTYSRMYGTSYLPTGPGLGPDWPSSLNSTLPYTSRYVPSYVPLNTTHRIYPTVAPASYYPPAVPRQNPPIIPSQQPAVLSDNYQANNEQFGNAHQGEDGLNLTITLHPNEGQDPNSRSYQNRSDYAQSRSVDISRGLTYSTNDQANLQQQKRRVQIIDQNPPHNSHEYPHDRNSRNSDFTSNHSHQNRTPDPHQPQPKHRSVPANPLNSSLPIQRRDHSEDNKHGSNQNVHEYLYGLAAPDPGSYVNSFRNHQRRLQDEKVGRKSVMSQYKTFAQNGGFGPAFGNTDHHVNADKMDTERKRKDYSKVVRENNHYKIEEQRRHHPPSEQSKDRGAPITKARRPHAIKSHFASMQEAREYAETIERPHNLRPVVRLRDPVSGQVIVRDPTHDQRISS